ncbi:MAG TPA: type II secretion system F family protein [Castellaniella sp.]|nr:type II secretion system F family protein [Castellaniella sp.]
MSLWLSSILIGSLVAVVAWWMLNILVQGWRAYETRLKADARIQFDEFFLFLDPAQLWGGLTLASVALGGLLGLLLGQWWMVPVIGAGLLGTPRFLMRQFKVRRMQRFDAQLPELVQALAGALRAGSGMQPALRHIVARSPVPLAQEFNLLLREQRVGVDFQQALLHLRERMPTEACSLVVSALGVAAQSGGSLSDTLEGIAQTLRARQHWEGRIRALTAQGRLQSWIMAVLPLLMMGILHRLEPEAMSLMWSTPAGWAVLMTVAVLELAGITFIQRIINIDI